MNKVLASLLMIGMVAAMAGAGTFAYFEDVETVAGNTITAGSLDLVINGDNPIESHFEVDGIQPSEKAVKRCINLTNIGDCDGYLSIWIVNLTDYDNGCTEPEGDVDTTCGDPGLGEGELSENLMIKIWEGCCGTATVHYVGTLANFTAHHYSQDTQLYLGDLDSGETRYFHVGCRVPNNVGNEIQTDSSEFDIMIDLLQYNYP
jgi:predicted ribosomally synthesized peptide with SipW-like signal peptide